MQQDKELFFGNDARARMLVGITRLAEAVGATLGPRGRNVVFEQDGSMPRSTKDGVTVARQIKFKDKFENIGAQMLREVAAKTADLAGDGPQPLWSKVLTPRGFISMAEVEAGMEICGTNGTTQTVVGVYPKGEREIYNVKFSNGRMAQCCEDHLWSIVTNYDKPIVIPLKDMVDDFCKVTSVGHKKYKYYVPITPVEFISSPENMPLDPYLVGLLIGDGSLSGSGAIELSLGKAKEHIIEKIKLPEGLVATAKYVDNKNYFRVKITGKTPDGLSVADFLSRIGLLGTVSDDKHIPKSYLYSSMADRKMLLQGLLDTDGYINNRGCFEFSTVSARLMQDFKSLAWSLGRVIGVIVHNRDNDPDSYSTKPIYRIGELLGYKNGIKIVDIEPTGIFTEMQCIKVSNADNLYITDDFLVTHNTTTATVLAHAIYADGVKAVAAGLNPMDLKRGIDMAVEAAVKFIASVAKPVAGREEYAQVATISANGDTIVGDKIAEAMDRVGKEGVITVEEAKGLEFEVEFVDGMSFDRGYLSPHFITNPEKSQAELEDAYILLYDGKIEGIQHFVHLLDGVLKEQKSLLIIADDVVGEALTMLVLNRMRGVLKVAAIKAPSFGDWKRAVLDDIAVLTGGSLIGDEIGVKLASATIAHLGRAKRVEVRMDTTTIIAGGGDPVKIQERCDQLRAAIEDPKTAPYIEERQRIRLAKLTGGVAVLKVGGATEVEVKERKDRVDDAIHATRAAAEEGIVPGGGVTLLYAISALDGVRKEKCKNDDQRAGVDIVRRALMAPIRKIVDNAGAPGLSGDVVIGRLLDHCVYAEGADNDGGPAHNINYGFDAQSLSFVNMLGAGIIDPAKVTRCALEDAASVAAVLITTEAVIADRPAEEKK